MHSLAADRSRAHLGQVGFATSHCRRQAAWNLCSHGSCITRCSCSGSWHTMHSSPICRWHLARSITFGRCGLDIQQNTPCSVFTCPVHSIGATNMCEADAMTSKTIWSAVYDARVDKHDSCTATCTAGSPSNCRLPWGLVAHHSLMLMMFWGPASSTTGRLKDCSRASSCWVKAGGLGMPSTSPASAVLCWDLRL